MDDKKKDKESEIVINKTTTGIISLKTENHLNVSLHAKLNSVEFWVFFNK